MHAAGSASCLKRSHVTRRHARCGQPPVAAPVPITTDERAISCLSVLELMNCKRRRDAQQDEQAAGTSKRMWQARDEGWTRAPVPPGMVSRMRWPSGSLPPLQQSLSPPPPGPRPPARPGTRRERGSNGGWAAGRRCLSRRLPARGNGPSAVPCTPPPHLHAQEGGQPQLRAQLLAALLEHFLDLQRWGQGGEGPAAGGGRSKAAAHAGGPCTPTPCTTRGRPHPTPLLAPAPRCIPAHPHHRPSPPLLCTPVVCLDPTAAYPCMPPPPLPPPTHPPARPGP